MEALSARVDQRVMDQRQADSKIVFLDGYLQALTDFQQWRKRKTNPRKEK